MKCSLIKGVVVAALLVACLGIPGLAQVEKPGVPVSFIMKTETEVHAVTMPPIDIPALLKEDSLDEQEGFRLSRYGYGYEADYNLNNSGAWETLENGGRLWRFRINCPGAYSINLIYNDFCLPKGARLFIYNEDRSMVIGAFTEGNNTENRRFATRPVKGGVSILEYYEPEYVEQPGIISIERIVYGYKDIFSWIEKDFGDGAPCNNNIVCPRGSPWHFQRRSVAMFIYAAGHKGCSGTMINQNIPGDEERQPYFLTAGHCDISGGSSCPACDINDVIFYFNYESPSCEPSADGDMTMTAHGSEVLISRYYGGEDFMLLKIGESIPPTYRVYYSGWDTRNLEVPSAVGIHHPRSDVKKITFFPGGTRYLASYGILCWGADMNDVWVDGTIDHCSSGSPLFESANRRVIGIGKAIEPWPWSGSGYHDPDVLCTSNDRTAVYVKFGIAMDTPSSGGRRVRDYLDPHSTHVEVLDGYDTYNLTGIVILIDRTGFMDVSSGGETRFSRAKAQALTDVENVFNAYPTVLIAVMSFSFETGTTLHQGLTSDKAKIDDAINNIPDPNDPGDPTSPLARAMSDAADYISALSASSPLLRQLWVYTSGGENASEHNNDSPVCGDCKNELAYPPTIGPDEWSPSCDPAESGSCTDYQECMIQGFIDNSVVNVGYFGSPILKGGQPGIDNTAHNPEYRQMDDFALLNFIAGTSGGTFSFESDVNQPPVASCRDVFLYTNEDCVADVSVNSGSYDPDGDPITLQQDPPPPYRLGVTPVTLTVTDPGGLTSSCQATVTVMTHLVRIAKIHNVLQGHYQNVSITLENDPFEFGGFDFLIAYDASALTFMEATPGQLLEDCGWEYFTYRYGVDGNCGDACPSGLLRIVALAETNNGPDHPSCYGPPDSDPFELAELKFYVTNDRTFECQFAPISFFWADCGDNAISSVDGNYLYVSKCIFNFDGFDTHNIADNTAGFPTYLGVQEECFDGDPGKPLPISLIDFINGGIDIICADSIDDRGDINLNGVAHEVADVTVFTNYFIYGLSAFVINVEGQIAATDVNADGIVLTVADLAYLIRIIVGDALPYPKVAPSDANYDIRNGVLSIDREVGAAHMVIRGNARPINLTNNMEMKSNYDSESNETHVLIFSLEKDQAFSGEFLKFDGILQEIEAATYEGAMVKLISDLLPKEFVLHQNRPNPFNPITDISFGLPVASDVTLEIFNINGQKIATVVKDRFEAGTHTAEWDGTNYASGVYLYKITAGDFSDTRKMLLIK